MSNGNLFKSLIDYEFAWLSLLRVAPHSIAFIDTRTHAIAIGGLASRPIESSNATSDHEVTLAESKIIDRLRSVSGSIVIIDCRTGALVVSGRSENCAANSHDIFLRST